MNDHHKHAWTTLQLAIVGVIMVSPFWLMASDLRDLSEAKSTGVGAALAGVAMAGAKLFEHIRGGKNNGQ